MEIQAILKVVASFQFSRAESFRGRSGQEIVESKRVSGCSDIALAFAYLCNKCGIRAYLLETLDKQYLHSHGHVVQGHVYCTVILSEDEWTVVDPTKGIIGASPVYDERQPILSYLQNDSLLSARELAQITA